MGTVARNGQGPDRPGRARRSAPPPTRGAAARNILFWRLTGGKGDLLRREAEVVEEEAGQEPGIFRIETGVVSLGRTRNVILSAAASPIQTRTSAGRRPKDLDSALKPRRPERAR